jgi:diaminopimelate epimerase
MHFEFWKYHGNGNDFVIINNINENLELNSSQIAQICHRRFGIGADGLILVNKSKNYDFEMLYHNSDGNLASMCGNGGRCVAAFAFSQKIAKKNMTFDAFDGKHDAVINNEIENGLLVSLKMADVKSVEINKNYYFLDTGSPHYVEFVDHVAEFDVFNSGRNTRNSEKFHPYGTNVNFAELSNDKVFVRTYERGVEEETLSCGTGVTASAIATYLECGKNEVDIHTLGGDFKVCFDVEDKVFTNIWLKAPAIEVYKGFLNYEKK